MTLKKVTFHLIYILVLLIPTELILRAVLAFYGYPFFKPSDYLYDGHYTNVGALTKTEIRNDDAVLDILILGGSVICTPYMNLESRLDTMLKKAYPSRKFAFYNVAAPAHTSLDNLIKYSKTEKQRFDLVIYYEGINDLHTNNIDAKDFQTDYSHVKWYKDIYLLLSHPEINFTVIPYLVHKMTSYILDRILKKEYLDQYGGTSERNCLFGKQIKTGLSYERNLLDIINIANQRGEKLLLLSYASYFPYHIQLTGEKEDLKHYSNCRFATPITMWGCPENVEAGINLNNKILKKLAKRHSVQFLDMENKMQKDSASFCDVCHVSEVGAQRFARELKRYIMDKSLVAN